MILGLDLHPPPNTHQRPPTTTDHQPPRKSLPRGQKLVPEIVQGDLHSENVPFSRFPWLVPLLGPSRGHEYLQRIL